MALTHKRDYGWWLGATTTDMLGRSSQNLALPFIIVGVTGSTAVAGNIQTLGLIAKLSVILLGGVLIDRMDRRHAMYLRGTIGAVLWGILAVLIMLDIVPLWAIAAIVLLVSISDGLFGLADNVALRSIMRDPKEYVQARGMSQARDAVVQVSGEPIGGLLYNLGKSVPFFFASACLAFMTFCAHMIRADLRPRPADEEKENPEGATATDTAAGAGGTGNSSTEGGETSRHPIRAALADTVFGFRYLFGEPRLRRLVIANTFIGSGMAAVICAVNFHLISLEYTPLQISLLSVLYAVMMMLGAMLASRLSPRLPGGKTIALAVLGMTGISTLAVFFHDYSQLLFFLGIYGLFTPFIGTMLGGYTFSIIPTELQGRTSSAASILEYGLTAFMPLITGNLVYGGNPQLAFSIGVVLNGFAFLLLLNRHVLSIGTPSTWEVA